MPFTTPPIPLDIEAEFPEFAGLARTTVRLHPRPGAPGADDSSMGGPLLWPAEEPWPVCTAVDEHPGPVPMVAVLQIFARDVPELPFPAGTDVLQVLWCPTLHELYRPDPLFRWRSAASVRERSPGLPAPEPDGWVCDDFLPRPCVLHPERVREFPGEPEFDRDLIARVDAWAEPQGWDYASHLGAAPGTKAGGWAEWHNGPFYPECACGTPMTHLLSIASWEHDALSWRRWGPLEETHTGRPEGADPDSSLAQEPSGVIVGRTGVMYLLTCTTCTHRPIVMEIQ